MGYASCYKGVHHHHIRFIVCCPLLRVGLVSQVSFLDDLSTLRCSEDQHYPFLAFFYRLTTLGVGDSLLRKSPEKNYIILEVRRCNFNALLDRFFFFFFFLQSQGMKINVVTIH